MQRICQNLRDKHFWKGKTLYFHYVYDFSEITFDHNTLFETIIDGKNNCVLRFSFWLASMRIRPTVNSLVNLI